eukprot:1121316-Rhodomonas_salina.1
MIPGYRVPTLRVLQLLPVGNLNTRNSKQSEIEHRARCPCHGHKCRTTEASSKRPGLASEL